MKIALLEDEPHLARHILDILEPSGHDCAHFNTGKSFTHAVTHDSFDMLIMDWQLPDMDGVDILKQIRATLDWPIPILFLTQREAEEDIVTALQAGADDYMVKPARAGELRARLAALARRHVHAGNEEETVQHGPFELNLRRKTMKLNGEALTLTDKDFELSCFLFENKGRLLSRKYLLDRVWGINSDINTRTVDTHMSRLRRKLGIKPENGFRIKTIYQHGYRLETVDPNAPAEAEEDA
ncbi:MAG: response regulator transcription factor [Hahellaceae bacterium]|nr:response regulator transcription factor [Hahellaceae bacterium]